MRPPALATSGSPERPSGTGSSPVRARGVHDVAPAGSSRRRPWAPGIVMLLAALVLACTAGSRSPCAPVAFAEGVAAEWTAARAAVDFEPVRPCAHDGRLRVTAVSVDTMPDGGGGFVPRVNQTVSRDGDRLFVFSETRAPVPFRAIPLGTRQLTVTLDGGGESARGFVGSSPSGAAIGYLRWRVDGLTYEVSATLRPVFGEADLESLARGTFAATR